MYQSIRKLMFCLGIIRSDACTYQSDWHCYDCHGEGALDYEMLIIESLDSDTESRRLSPVALLGNKYIDLNNGNISVL